MRDIVKIEISCSSLVQVTNTQHNLYLFQSGEWNFISRGWEPESIIECTRTVYNINYCTKNKEAMAIDPVIEDFCHLIHLRFLIEDYCTVCPTNHRVKRPLRSLSTL